MKRRLPRKLKKSVIKKFGRRIYIDYTKNDNIIYKARIDVDMTNGKFKDIFKGYQFFYKIE